MSEKFTLYNDSEYENHATNELPLARKNISKKEEQSKAYIKPIILDRNKNLNDNNWELGHDYIDFTGYEIQCAFEDGWDACEAESIEIIKTAEDHAYFAGSEAMREKLIDKACDFLETYPHMFMGICRSEMIEDFRKAMEE